METDSFFLGHRSIRKYREQPVEEAILREIIHCGLRGSSSGNMQTWSVIISRDPEQKKRLYEAHYNQAMVLQAPVVMTFCSDLFRMREWIRVNQSRQSFDDMLGFLTGALDAAIAAQNVALAAESRGLGMCYMGTTLWSADKIIEILALPECVFPVSSMVLGYPDENPEIRDRLPLDVMIHEEKYRHSTDQQIKEIHAAREKSAWERYTSNTALKEQLTAMGIDKVTDFYTSELKYSKKLHAKVSEMLLETLRTQKLWL